MFVEVWCVPVVYKYSMDQYAYICVLDTFHSRTIQSELFMVSLESAYSVDTLLLSIWKHFVHTLYTLSRTV